MYSKLHDIHLKIMGIIYIIHNYGVAYKETKTINCALKWHNHKIFKGMKTKSKLEEGFQTV